MKTATLIKHNNNLKQQLTKENKKYFDEFLVILRSKALFKDEKQLETILLEIEQDLILYQNQGKTFDEIYGDTKTLADKIADELPSAPKRKILSLISMMFLIFFTIYTIPYLFANNIYPLEMLFISFIGSTLGILISRITLAYNKWYIYLVSGLLLSTILLGIPLLLKHGYLSILKIYSIELTPFIIAIFLFIYLTTIILTIHNFKQ